MGGLAFSSGQAPLMTPRMPSKIYDYVLDDCRAKLQQLFITVATPIPGPAKKDHGDIDIFLATEKHAMFPSSMDTHLLESLSPSYTSLDLAAHILGAERIIKSQPKVATIAIPWLKNLPSEIADSDLKDAVEVSNPRYIQVDLHHCDTLEQLQWILFKHAHGDIWSIIGSIIRPFGLTIDEDALFIRIPEIEHLNRKQAKVLLTKDPHEVLDFLGLKHDRTQWEEPFASVTDLFEYVATCRLFWVRPLADEENSHNTLGHDTTGMEGGEIDKSKLKSNDRRRMNQRPIFRKWAEEFKPACQQAGRFTTQTATRDSVRAEAFARFPGTQSVYTARLLEWRRERQRQTLWRDVIKASVPPNDEEPTSQHWRSTAAAALKKIILQDDYSLEIRPAAPLRDEGTGLYDLDATRRFVVDNWRRVGEAAWRQLQDRHVAKVATETVMKLVDDAAGEPDGGSGDVKKEANPTGQQGALET
ncbi:hypothetical protein GGR52DRAFT_562298 [Hypoxylon sp. FL1284]|nr:hypothetical protein GGR52DRAFT_562298 [Hypoxylon sp. FL1284]